MRQPLETVPPITLTRASTTMLDLLATWHMTIGSCTCLTQAITDLLQPMQQMLADCSLLVTIEPSASRPALTIHVPPIPTDSIVTTTDVLPLGGQQDQPIYQRRFPIALSQGTGWFHCTTSKIEIELDTSYLTQTLTLFAAMISTTIRYTEMRQLLDQKTVEIEQLEQSLVLRNKLATIGELAAGVLHELATPSTCILAYTELLLRRHRQLQQQDMLMYIERVHDAANHIRNLTRDVLTFAKHDERYAQIVSLRDAVQHALRLCQHMFDRSAIAVTTDVAPSLPPIRMVFTHLIQVLVNLIVNAVEAMDSSGGTLSITADCDDDESLTMRVTDTGPGIAPEHLDDVFAPFFSTQHRTPNAGLGLSIVHQILTSLGGNVEVESQLGKGTTFVVSLPVDKQMLNAAVG